MTVILRDPRTECSNGTYEHPLIVTFEDASTIQGHCRDCGTEFNTDKTEPGYG